MFGKQPSHDSDIPFDRSEGFENAAYSTNSTNASDPTYVEVPPLGASDTGSGYMDIAPKPQDPVYADVEGLYTDVAPMPDKQGLYVDVAEFPDDFGNASEDEEDAYMDVAPNEDADSEFEFGHATEEENEGSYMDIAPLESTNTDDYDFAPNHSGLSVVQVTPQSDLPSDVDI